MSIGPWVFNGFDIVVLLVVIISMLMALGRGFFREFISISALVIAGGFALFAFGRFRPAAHDFIKIPGWLADGALALGSFAFAYMLVSFVLSGIVKSVKGKNVGFIDRLLGAGFGGARGLLIAALFTMIATASYREGQAAQEFKSRVLENQQSLPEDVLENAPRDVRDWLEKPPPELPGFIQGSTLYPLLDKIGDALRALPFTKVRTAADNLKSGDLSRILESVKE